MSNSPQHKSEAPLIEAKDVEVRFGGHAVLTGASVTVRAGEIVTLIGPNGAGKTSLVRALLGLVKPAKGSVSQKKGLRIGYMPQRLSIDSSLARPAKMPTLMRHWLRLGRDT